MILQTPPSCDNLSRRNHETGIVLVVAMIALLIMSLAAVALIRSVDTSTLIAGNISFRQSATISADSGMESAITWLSNTNINTLDNDSLANGYYATSEIWCSTTAGTTCQATKTATYQYLLDVTSDAIWAVGRSAAATGTGIDSSTQKDSSGNKTRYIIQRMCRTTGAPTPAQCLFGNSEAGSSGQGVKDATQAGAVLPTGSSPMYRVTARVFGPKNTASYIQAFVY
jgi:type IV pilus assembly protein PilX